jgi:hypothetical protein
MRWTVFLLVLMAGCSAHTQVQYSAGSVGAVPPGTSMTQSSVRLNVQGGSAAVALVGLGIIAAGMYDMERYRSEPAELSPTRLISEQDCTKPIDWTRGNLKCR